MFLCWDTRLEKKYHTKIRDKSAIVCWRRISAWSKILDQLPQHFWSFGARGKSVMSAFQLGIYLVLLIPTHYLIM